MTEVHKSSTHRLACLPSCCAICAKCTHGGTAFPSHGPSSGALVAKGELVRLLPEWSLPGAGIYAVTLKRTLLTRKVSAAIEALSAYLAELEEP